MGYLGFRTLAYTASNFYHSVGLQPLLPKGMNNYVCKSTYW